MKVYIRDGQKTVTIWAILKGFSQSPVEIGSREEIYKKWYESYKNRSGYAVGSKAIRIGSKEFKDLGLEAVPKN